MELNLYLELPGAWAERVRGIARRLGSLANTIDLDVSVPHLTLYLAEFPFDAQAEALRLLPQIAHGAGPIATHVTGLKNAGRGYIFVEVERTAALAALHAAALVALSPLRKGLVSDDVRELAKSLPPRERELALLHGFAWVAELYRPHVTVAKLPEARADEAVEFLGAASAIAGDIAFTAIGLGVTGPHGTVARSLARAPLG